MKRSTLFLLSVFVLLIVGCGVQAPEPPQAITVRMRDFEFEPASLTLEAEAAGSWSLDSEASGFEKMESGINGRALDLAKLGWLYLHNGRNGERQVVPAAWVDEATRVDGDGDPNPGYQYFWWVDEGRNAYFAEGNFYQDIYVVPAAELVLVRLGRDCGGVYWTGLLGQIADWLGPRLDLAAQ